MKIKNLEILAAEIGQEIKEKNAELEARDIEVPEEYHKDMLAFIRKLDQETARKEKKRAHQYWMRTAALFLVCFVGMNAAALGTSEAYREKIFSLFYDNEQGGLTLNFDPASELIEEWEDYWYPTWLPEGYQLYAAERTENMDFMLFMSEDMNEELRITVRSDNTEYSFDTETLEYERVKIGYYDAYYFSDPSISLQILVCGFDETTFIMENIGILEKDNMLKIAEKMKNIK